MPSQVVGLSMANFAEQLENETAIELAFLEYILYQSTVVRLDCARSLSNLAPHFDNLNEPSDSPIHGASINDFASGSLLSENNASSNNFHRSSSQNLSDYYENSSCSNSKKCKLDFVSMAATPLSQIGCENFKEIVKPRINASEECSILRENSEKHQIILDLNNKNSHSVAFEDLEKENQSIINTLQGDSGNVSINNQNASHEKIDSGQINPISETRTTNSHARKKTISNVSLDIVRLHKASNLFTLSMNFVNNITKTFRSIGQTAPFDDQIVSLINWSKFVDYCFFFSLIDASCEPKICRYENIVSAFELLPFFIPHMTSDLVVQLFTHLIICAFEQKPNPETSQLFLSLYEPVKGIVKYPSENLMIIASKIFKVHRRFSSEISMKLDCELQFVNRIIKDKEPSLWATLIADHRPWDQFRNNLSSQLFTKFNEIVAKPPVITFFERILKQKKTVASTSDDDHLKSFTRPSPISLNNNTRSNSVDDPNISSQFEKSSPKNKSDLAIVKSDEPIVETFVDKGSYNCLNGELQSCSQTGLRDIVEIPILATFGVEKVIENQNLSPVVRSINDTDHSNEYPEDDDLADDRLISEPESEFSLFDSSRNFNIMRRKSDSDQFESSENKTRKKSLIEITPNGLSIMTDKSPRDNLSQVFDQHEVALSNDEGSSLSIEKFSGNEALLLSDSPFSQDRAEIICDTLTTDNVASDSEFSLSKSKFLALNFIDTQMLGATVNDSHNFLSHEESTKTVEGHLCPNLNDTEKKNTLQFNKQQIITDSLNHLSDNDSIIFDEKEFKDFEQESTDLIEKNSFKSTDNVLTSSKKTRTLWTEEFMQYLRRGTSLYGNNWSMILKSFDFDPGITVRSLRNVARRTLLVTNYSKKSTKELEKTIKSDLKNDCALIRSDIFKNCTQAFKLEDKEAVEVLSKRVNWSNQEELDLREGFSKYGRNWLLIRSKYNFHPKRTNVDLKDKARQLRLY